MPRNPEARPSHHEFTIEADAGVLDDLDPLVVFRRHERLEPVRREFDHVTAILLEARLELRRRLRNLPLQAGDRGRRGISPFL